MKLLGDLARLTSTTVRSTPYGDTGKEVPVSYIGKESKDGVATFHRIGLDALLSRSGKAGRSFIHILM